jgi:hypothetical protein
LACFVDQITIDQFESPTREDAAVQQLLNLVARKPLSPLGSEIGRRWQNRG